MSSARDEREQVVGRVENGSEPSGLARVRLRVARRLAADTHVFAKIPIANLRDPGEIQEGVATITLPFAGAVPSFTAKHNSIHWQFSAKGDIPRWPDVDDEFEIEIVGVRRKQATAEAA